MRCPRPAASVIACSITPYSPKLACSLSKISNNSKPSLEERAKAQYQVRLRGVALQLYKLRRAAVKDWEHGHLVRIQRAAEQFWSVPTHRRFGFQINHEQSARGASRLPFGSY